MQHCLYENVLLCTIHHLLIFTNVRLFVRDRVISYPPSPVDTNATLFVRERVIACRSSPIDTNVRLFEIDRVIAYPPSPIDHDNNGKMFVSDWHDIGFPALVVSMSIMSSYHW